MNFVGEMELMLGWRIEQGDADPGQNALKE